MIKRIIILILILVIVFVVWKSQKSEVVPPTKEDPEKSQEVDTKTPEEQPEDKAEDNLVEKLKKESVKKTESKEDEEEPKVEDPKEEAPKEEEPEIKVIEVISPKPVVKPPVVKVEPKVEPVVELAPRFTDLPQRETKVKIFMYEWSIDVSLKDIPSGTVVFEVVNNGKFTHDFSIRDLEDFGKVRPKETRVFTTQIGEGDYEIFSTRGKDFERNMVEDISVVK